MVDPCVGVCVDALLVTLIEGPFQAGDRTVVIEDVTTTGGSARRAVQATARPTARWPG